MGYKTPAALEMAVKQAARDSGQDTNRAISGFYFHRLLCRVFDDGDDRFVLKGGQGMLARTVDARATRDIDLLSTRASLDGALSDLLALAEKDLGDFVRFEYAGAEPIKAEDEYRSGMSVRFVPILGAKRMQGISIDLVVDKVPLDGAERLTPADRISVAGLRTCDYLVYPVAAALSDKFCALHELHGERPSSRVKDLVDIAVYATTSDVEAGDLRRRLEREIAAMKLGSIESFGLPAEWDAQQEIRYERLARQTGLPDDLRDMRGAEGLARRLFDPILSGMRDEARWSHETLGWER